MGNIGQFGGQQNLTNILGQLGGLGQNQQFDELGNIGQFGGQQNLTNILSQLGGLGQSREFDVLGNIGQFGGQQNIQDVLTLLGGLGQDRQFDIAGNIGQMGGMGQFRSSIDEILGELGRLGGGTDMQLNTSVGNQLGLSDLFSGYDPTRGVLDLGVNLTGNTNLGINTDPLQRLLSGGLNVNTPESINLAGPQSIALEGPQSIALDPSQNLVNLMNQLGQSGTLGGDLQSMLNTIGGLDETQFSPEQRQAMVRQLLQNALGGRTFTPSTYIPEGYTPTGGGGGAPAEPGGGAEPGGEPGEQPGAATGPEIPRPLQLGTELPGQGGMGLSFGELPPEQQQYVDEQIDSLNLGIPPTDEMRNSLRDQLAGQLSNPQSRAMMAISQQLGSETDLDKINAAVQSMLGLSNLPQQKYYQQNIPEVFKGAQDQYNVLAERARTEGIGDILGGIPEGYSPEAEAFKESILGPVAEQQAEQKRQLESYLAATGQTGSTMGNEELNRMLESQARGTAGAKTQAEQGLQAMQTQAIQDAITRMSTGENILNTRTQAAQQPLAMLLSALTGQNVAPQTIGQLQMPQQGGGIGGALGGILGGLAGSFLGPMGAGAGYQVGNKMFGG